MREWRVGLAALGVALALGGRGWAQPGSPDNHGYSVSAERQCRAQRGDYVRVCMLGRYSCVVRYRDAGRRCRNSSECQGGRCEWRGSGHPTGPVTGRCSANSNPCGCFTTVENGRVAGGMCVD